MERIGHKSGKALVGKCHDKKQGIKETNDIKKCGYVGDGFLLPIVCRDYLYAEYIDGSCAVVNLLDWVCLSIR